MSDDQIFNMYTHLRCCKHIQELNDIDQLIKVISWGRCFNAIIRYLFVSHSYNFFQIMLISIFCGKWCVSFARILCYSRFLEFQLFYSEELRNFPIWCLPIASIWCLHCSRLFVKQLSEESVHYKHIPSLCILLDMIKCAKLLHSYDKYWIRSFMKYHKIITIHHEIMSTRKIPTKLKRMQLKGNASQHLFN